MKTDLYTKIILTVIAGSLLVLAVRPAIEFKKAYASAGPVEVNIVEINGKKIKTKMLGAAEGALPITSGVDILGNDLPVSVAIRR